jgi:hypothetical protein
MLRLAAAQETPERLFQLLRQRWVLPHNC